MAAHCPRKAEIHHALSSPVRQESAHKSAATSPNDSQLPAANAADGSSSKIRASAAHQPRQAEAVPPRLQAAATEAIISIERRVGTANPAKPL